MSEENPRGEREDGPNTDREPKDGRTDRERKRDGGRDALLTLLGAVLSSALPKGGIHQLRLEAERREVRSESRDANNAMGEIEYDPPTGDNIAKHRDGIQRLITELVGTPVDRIDGLVVAARCWTDYDPEQEHDDGHHHVCELPDGRKVVAKMLMCGMGDTRLAKALLMKLACQLEEIEMDEHEAEYQRRIAAGEEPCALCGEFHDDEEHHEAEKPAAETNTR